MSIAVSVLHSIRSLVRSRAALHFEVLALRHQLLVLERSRRPRVRLTAAARLLGVWFSRLWTGWRTTLVLVQPETVVDWHRRGFRWFWTWKGRRRTGRPTVPADVRAQQLRNAFPDDACPSYLLHDRDAVFTGVASTVAAMGIHDVVTAPRSPWQKRRRFTRIDAHDTLRLRDIEDFTPRDLQFVGTDAAVPRTRAGPSESAAWSRDRRVAAARGGSAWSRSSRRRGSFDGSWVISVCRPGRQPRAPPARRA